MQTKYLRINHVSRDAAAVRFGDDWIVRFNVSDIEREAVKAWIAVLHRADEGAPRSPV